MEKLKPHPVEARLIARKQLTPDVWEYHYEPTPPFLFYPGQFVSVVIPGAGPGGRDLRRAYSIASSPELTRSGKSVFELCVKLVDGGPGTTYLHSIKEGESIKGLAPYGDFVYRTHGAKHVMFISTGTGIAPFRSMVFSKIFQQSKPKSAVLLFGARAESDLLYIDELRAATGVTQMVAALSRPSSSWTGFKGRVTDWMRAHQDEILWSETEFYLCGNGAMIDEVKALLIEKGVGKPCVHQEVYYKPKPGESHASQ